MRQAIPSDQLVSTPGALGTSEALAVLSIFVAYQLHRFGRTHSTVLLALTVLDGVVMVLIWREYRSRKEIVRTSATAKPGQPMSQ